MQTSDDWVIALKESDEWMEVYSDASCKIANPKHLDGKNKLCGIPKPRFTHNICLTKEECQKQISMTYCRFPALNGDNELTLKMKSNLHNSHPNMKKTLRPGLEPLFYDK